MSSSLQQLSQVTKVLRTGREFLTSMTSSPISPVSLSQGSSSTADTNVKDIFLVGEDSKLCKCVTTSCTSTGRRSHTKGSRFDTSFTSCWNPDIRSGLRSDGTGKVASKVTTEIQRLDRSASVCGRRPGWRLNIRHTEAAM